MPIRFLKITLLLLLAAIDPLKAIEKERIFYLKSGDKIKATVISEDKKNLYLKTSMGKITIEKSDVQLDMIEIYLNNGDQVKGILLEQNDKTTRLKTSFGEITIQNSNIRNLNFTPKTRLNDTIPDKDDRWYFSDEQLIDVWFDPTGFTLKKNELYFSALTWGVGITNRFQISSSWFNYFSSDFNIRPKFMVFEKGNIRSRQAFSIGAHLHTASQPDKYQFTIYRRKESGYFDTGTDSWVEKEHTITSKEWIKVGSNYNDIKNSYSDNDKCWGEVFAAYTLSNQRASGQGRINYTFGASMIYYPDASLMPRIFTAIDIDISRHLKIMAEIFYDPYYRPIYHDKDKDIELPVFFDIGFITNKVFNNNNLWLGIHFQKPVIALYYKY